MTNINTNAVRRLMDNFHRRVVDNPAFYTAGPETINVTLPQELLHFANAASGHSGFGSGARPVGIRRTSTNARAELRRIFSSVESVIAFLRSSECNADEYIREVRARHARAVSQPEPVQVDPAIAVEESEAIRLFREYSSLIRPANRADFRLDLHDVVAGNITIEELIAEYV